MEAPTAAAGLPDQLGLPLLHKGKVRELYALDADRLLMVATDQISAFDFVLCRPSPTRAGSSPGSRLVVRPVAELVANHVLPAKCRRQVAGRAVVCERLEMIPSSAWPGAT